MNVAEPFFNCVLFDLDNTLLDRDAGFERFCREIYRTSSAMSGTHTEEQTVSLMKTWDQDESITTPIMWERFIAQWPGVFSNVDQAMSVFLEMFPMLLVLDPRTRNMLEDFYDNGIRCGIVTNGGSQMQVAKIEESGLVALVDSYTISGTLGTGKPDAQIFYTAMEKVDGIPDKTLFVGDNVEQDILGANKVGIKTAWMALGRVWPDKEPEPDFIIHNIWDVQDLVLKGTDN